MKFSKSKHKQVSPEFSKDGSRDSSDPLLCDS